MDWIEKMNAAINYIEDNLKGDINYNQVAKAACCPTYHFQRMFVFITEVPLSEYIRRRRLTLAAFELQQSNKSVIEIAQEYGYESHSSFTRAFSEFHGVPPIAARKSGTKLKAYPPMSFHISIKGATEMNYRIEKLNAFSAVGVKYLVKTENALNSVARIWQEVSMNGIGEKLLNLMGLDLEKEPKGLMGILSDGSWGNNDEFFYHITVPYKKETPEGMEKLNIPESHWVVFEATDLTGIVKAWKSLYTDWIPTSNYYLADLPAIECYYPPGHKPQNELWIPIIKKS